MAATDPNHKKGRRNRGFERTSGLLQGRIRAASEKRGFAVTRLLTHWPEIVGEETARIARPVKVGYGREGFGPTLTILTTGAQAPILEMQKEKLRERVNACYGYNAISKIRITQTAPAGFAEGQAQFGAAPAPKSEGPSAKIKAQAAAAVTPVSDDDLRAALAVLGENILSRSKR